MVKGNKRILLAVAGAVIALGLFAWLLLPALSDSENSGQSYVAKVNDEEILLSEYYIYLREQKITYEETGEGADIWDTYFDGISAMAVAKQNALDSVVYVKVMAGEAKRQNISLSQAEEKECAEEAALFYSEFTLGEQREIPYEYTERVMIENALLQKLFETASADYVRDEESFQDYFNVNQSKFGKLWFNYIEIPFAGTNAADEEAAYEKAFALWESAFSGKGFNEIGDDSEGVIFHEWVEDQEIAAMGIVFAEPLLYPPGFIDRIYEDANGFYLIEVAYNTIFEPETLIIAGEEFDDIAKKEAFDQQYSTLLRNAVVEKNSNLWDSISFIED